MADPEIIDLTTLDMLDVLPLGVCAVEHDLNIGAWNRTLEEWTRIPRDEALGRSLDALFPDAIVDSVRERLRGVFECGYPAVFSAALHGHFIPIPDRRNPSELMAQQTEARLLSSEPARVLITIQDVTELTRHIRLLQDRQERLEAAQAQAEEASRMKTAFLANMSHEIRTPMNAILGYTDVMLQSNDLRGEHLTSLQTIKRSGDHLMAIINDILDISKIEAGRLEVRDAATSPCEILEEVIYLMRPNANDRNISLRAEYHCPLPRVIRSDPTRMRQILVNLVGNAIKFTERGGVTVSLRACGNGPDPRITFEVRDTGIGMNDEQARDIFVPFVQADSSTTRRYGGTGLGLSICRRLAEALGGSIELVRSRPGEGSTFRLELPAISVPGAGVFESRGQVLADFQASETRSPSRHSPPGRLDGLHVLLAEDARDNQRLVAFHLEKAGARVTIAENGHVAVEKIRWAGRGRRETDAPRPFDLVLMDMHMPVVDGYQATREIRRLGIRIPVIALTAMTMADDREKCLDVGCSDYARKPIDRESLVRLCEKWSGRADRTDDERAAA